MSKNSLDFCISQQIIHHNKAIRSLDTLGSLVLTGSLDKTCAFFDKDKDGKYLWQMQRTISLIILCFKL